MYVESEKKKRERERTDWWLPEEKVESWENRLSESKHKEKNKIKNKVEWIHTHRSIYPYPHP